MTYHHYRRLSEHWPEATNKLSPAAKLVALTIANHLNLESGRWAISAKTISSWAGGLSRGSIDTAVKKLEALGVFEVSRDSQRKPREFRLLVECSQECDRIKDHNTPTERQLALARPKTTPTELLNLETPPNELPNLSTTELLNLERELPNLLATNKELIKINKKDDSEDSFEFLFITETLKELNETNQFNSGHALLKAALDSDKELVIERAQEVMAKGTVPKKYLKASIINHPESLIKRTAKDDTDNKLKTDTQKFMSELAKQELKKKHASQWNALMKSEPTLLEWDSISDLGHPLSGGYLNFLARVCPQTLTTTAAKIVSKASHYDINLYECKSLTEAGERTSEYPDPPTLATLRQQAAEAKERALRPLQNAAINQETF